VIALDIYVPVAIRATEADRPCPRCGARMSWIPAAPAVDLAFAPTPVEVLQPDGTHKQVMLTSLNQLRQLEHQSEIRARNGEGQQMVWRDYSQDRSNQDAHTLGDPLGGAPVSKAAAAKFGRRGTFKALGTEAPTAELGPGVTDANVSALQD
jgi:hypothetical protein